MGIRTLMTRMTGMAILCSCWLANVAYACGDEPVIRTFAVFLPYDSYSESNELPPGDEDSVGLQLRQNAEVGDILTIKDSPLNVIGDLNLSGTHWTLMGDAEHVLKGASPSQLTWYTLQGAPFTPLPHPLHVSTSPNSGAMIISLYAQVDGSSGHLILQTEATASTAYQFVLITVSSHR